MELFIGKTDKINKFLNWTYVKSAHEWEGKKTFDAGSQHQGTDDTEKKSHNSFVYKQTTPIR